jgi:hypothetical protein
VLRGVVRILRRFLEDVRGDMIWGTIIVASVLLPLASLSIDVPRYYTLRSTLQSAADAAAEGASRCVNGPVFENMGEDFLYASCVGREAVSRFYGTANSLAGKGFSYRIVGVSLGYRSVTVRAEGSARVFFGILPGFTVHVQATSNYRPVRQ